MDHDQKVVHSELATIVACGIANIDSEQIGHRSLHHRNLFHTRILQLTRTQLHGAQLESVMPDAALGGVELDVVDSSRL
jgi:hypothetical protein